MASFAQMCAGLSDLCEGRGELSTTDDQEIKAILAELQEEIRRHRLALGDLGALPPPDPLARVREKQAVNPHLPIGWPVMPPGLIPKLVAYAQKIMRRLLRWYINPIVAQQNEFNAAATDLLASHQARLDELTTSLEALTARLSGFDARWTALQSQIETELETTRLRMQRLENWRRESVTHDEASPSEEKSPGKIDYFLLGALYRNRYQMAERLNDYDDVLVKLASATRPLLPVLDIGCGRGEFVGHMNALGLPAYGIDLDADALAIGREQGLDLRQVDAISHLKALSDNGLSAVTMIQVVEHFEPEALMELLYLIERKLQPGGLILAETVNSECLYALINWYLRDPSHRTPLHSATLRFLIMQAGFHQIETRFLHPVPEAERLQTNISGEEALDPAVAALAAQIRHNTERLNHLLYGPQDYAVLAYKPEK